MLQVNTLDFLTQLWTNNNKDWFDRHRKPYDTAKSDVLALLTRVLAGLEQADPAIAASGLTPKSCLFRINRDVRFSADKSPYKTSFGAWFSAGGKKAPSAGYYLHINPEHAFVAGGMYQPDPKLLAAVRQEIDYNLTGFEQLLAAPGFQTYYHDLNRDNGLTRPPKGYTANNPAIEHLKLKSFTASHPLPSATLTSPQLTSAILDAFAALQPLVTFLNWALV